MIISYNDKEVERFHPICEKALNLALERLGVKTQYSVYHHRFVGQLEMDFVITNNDTNKVLCVVEVKRTPAAVKSSRYQYQAMSYIQQTPSAMIERPYYMLTNIEYSCLFKYDAIRPNVHQQLLSPGIIHCVDFADAESERQLIGTAAEHYAALLKTVMDDSGEYYRSLDEIITLITSAKDNNPAWNSQFARVAYEYIRGSFDAIGRENQIKAIREYNQRIASLQRVFEQIDFKGIFGLDNYGDIPELSSKTLSGIYSFGKENIDADEMVTAIHQIVSAEYESEGEVPTDMELARLMTVVAKHFVPEIHGAVCDPAAGSGNLLSCISESFSDIKPSQIKANDKNPLLLQLLSMRLGLKFPTIVSPGNSPKVTAENIAKLAPSYFEGIELVLVNPPMVSAISSISHKEEMYQRMHQLGFVPKTNTGQSPLEAAFMELLNVLVKDDCVTVALLPKTHLTALGEGMVALRKFLLGDFGLCLIFNYPGKGLFEKVAKDTVMVVGRKGRCAEEIAVVNSLDAVADIDLNAVASVLNSGKSASEFGLECMHRSYSELQESIVDGWIADSITIETVDFLDKYFNNNYLLCQLESLSANIYRGQAGNSGLTDLMYIPAAGDLFESLSPANRRKLCAGMRNAKYNNIEVGQGDNSFLNSSLMSARTLNKLIADYLDTKHKKGKQKKNTKTKEDVLRILELESKHSCQANAVLLPRDLRKFGKAYRCSQPTFVSTNFFIIEGLSEVDSKLMASWMTTIFYQLCCERYGKNQEGTRKMERGELFKTLIPDLVKLSQEEKETILREGSFQHFLDLQNPEIRNVDLVWANKLFGEQGKKILNDALDLLQRKATSRNR